MKEYRIFFRRAKLKIAEKEKRRDGLLHMIAPSMFAICICAICLCGASWAWFTASVSTGMTRIQSSSYKLLYQITENTAETELAEAGTTVTLTEDRCVIKLKAAGTEGATGYCSVQIGNKTYYTEQIFVNDNPEYNFTIEAAGGTSVILTPKWGSCAVRNDSNVIANNGTITGTGSQQSSIQTPDSAVTTESSAAPSTELTTPATNSSPAATDSSPSTTSSSSTTTSSSPAASESTASEPAAATEPESLASVVTPTRIEDENSEDSNAAEPYIAPENTATAQPELSISGEDESN